MTDEQAKEIIQLLKDMNRKLDLMAPTVPFISIPFIATDRCIDGGLHDYPQMWHGIIPPTCTKCGKSSQPNVTTTSSSNCADPISFCTDCKCGKKAKALATLELKDK